MRAFGRKGAELENCVPGIGDGIRFVRRDNVAVVVTVMSDSGHSKSWSAVGSHGRCRPIDGRSADTLARGVFCWMMGCGG
jgi:hypothetical protein